MSRHNITPAVPSSRACFRMIRKPGHTQAVQYTVLGPQHLGRLSLCLNLLHVIDLAVPPHTMVVQVSPRLVIVCRFDEYLFLSRILYLSLGLESPWLGGRLGDVLDCTSRDHHDV
jgi:hypothetical protein